MAARTSASQNLRAEIIAKAIANPAFRKKLFAKPEEVFGGKLTAADTAALERMKRFLPALSDIVGSLAGEVLCGGGGCGGLA